MELLSWGFVEISRPRSGTILLIESAHNGFKLDLSGILQGTRFCTWRRQRVEPYTRCISFVGYHQWQHCTEQEYCLPKKTLSISCHSLTVALESRCFWYLLLLDLSNNAKCLATEQSKQVSDSCSFQLKMILTKKWQNQQFNYLEPKHITEKAQHFWWGSMQQVLKQFWEGHNQEFA